MACCKGEKIPYEEVFPEELKTLRNNLVNYVGGNVGLGATPYGGEIAAPVNPASNAALNMVMGMMGYGGYNQQPGLPYTGGQQGSPYIHENDEERYPPPPPPPPPPPDDPPKRRGGDPPRRRGEFDPYAAY